MTTITEPKAQSHSSSWSSVGAAISHIMRTLMAWHHRARERRQLLSLGDHALKDIGRSRADLLPSMPRAVWVIGDGDQPYWRARITCPEDSRSLLT
jgi:uncharacterized protein YjiS (DUF1127 family)